MESQHVEAEAGSPQCQQSRGSRDQRVPDQPAAPAGPGHTAGLVFTNKLEFPTK